MVQRCGGLGSLVQGQSNTIASINAIQRGISQALVCSTGRKLRHQQHWSCSHSGCWWTCHFAAASLAFRSIQRWQVSFCKLLKLCLSAVSFAGIRRLASPTARVRSAEPRNRRSARRTCRSCHADRLSCKRRVSCSKRCAVVHKCAAAILSFVLRRVLLVRSFFAYQSSVLPDFLRKCTFATFVCFSLRAALARSATRDSARLARTCVQVIHEQELRDGHFEERQWNHSEKGTTNTQNRHANTCSWACNCRIYLRSSRLQAGSGRARH